MIIHPLAPPTSNLVPAGSQARLLLVNQIDHAAFAAEVLSLWRANGLPENPRRDALVRGTREHDNGWAETDSAPRRRVGGPHEGKPHDFRSIPTDVRLELFERGVRRKAASDPEAWVYVVRHARELHKDDGGIEEWDRALAEWEAVEDELRERTGFAEADVVADYRLLWIADSLSLAACLRWSEPRTVNGTRMRVTETGEEMSVDLHLDPFPLAGSTTFKIRCRIVPDRVYTGDADLAVETASATWRDLRVRISPEPER